MFDSLSDRLSRTIKNLRGQGRITEDNIKDTMRDVRMALLEADVALPVVRDFVERVKQRAIGQEVMSSLSPGQALIKIVDEELVATMGEANEGLNLAAQPPAVVLMAGLQGAGKTTTVAKLAKLLQERHNKKVMVVSCDVYRPAAIKQLQTLAGQVGASFYPSEADQQPVEIARAALDAAKKQFQDVLLVDTAGRLHIDETMMGEIQQIHQAVNPVETLFVVDSMTGQDAAVTAKAFNDALALTGWCLPKPMVMPGAVRRCRFARLPVSRSSFSVPVKRSTRWNRFIRTAWPHASWAWGMCSAWLKKYSARWMWVMRRNWPVNSRKAARLTSMT